MMPSVGFSRMQANGLAKLCPPVNKTAKNTPPMIEPTLKSAEESAGIPNLSRALRIPMACAASATKSMNGIIIRVSRTVSANFAGSFT